MSELDHDIIHAVFAICGAAIGVILILLKIMANMIINNIKDDIHQCQDRLLTMIERVDNNASMAHSRLDKFLHDALKPP